MEHADRFLRRFYIEKGMFGSLSVTFIFYRPPLSESEGSHSKKAKQTLVTAEPNFRIENQKRKRKPGAR